MAASPHGRHKQTDTHAGAPPPLALLVQPTNLCEYNRPSHGTPDVLPHMLALLKYSRLWSSVCVLCVPLYRTDLIFPILLHFTPPVSALQA